MKKRKPPETYAELADAIADLLYGTEPESPEDIDAAIIDAGIDPEEFSSRMREAAEEALSASPLNWRNRAPKEIEIELEKLKGLSIEPDLERSEILDNIKRIIDQLEGEQLMLAFAHHRNLENATDEDLASLLEDLQFLAGYSNGEKSS